MQTYIQVVIDLHLHSHGLIFIQIIVKCCTMIFKAFHNQVFLAHVQINLVHFLGELDLVAFDILEQFYLRVILGEPNFGLFHSSKLLNYLILQVRHFPLLGKHFLIKLMLLIPKGLLLFDKIITDVFQFANKHLLVRLSLIFH